MVSRISSSVCLWTSSPLQLCLSHVAQQSAERSLREISHSTADGRPLKCWTSWKPWALGNLCWKLQVWACKWMVLSKNWRNCPDHITWMLEHHGMTCLREVQRDYRIGWPHKLRFNFPWDEYAFIHIDNSNIFGLRTLFIMYNQETVNMPPLQNAK